MEQYGEANLRPSTKAGYLSTMKNHIFPYIGDVALVQLTPAMLDDMYGKIKAAGLSASVVRCSHKIMGVSLEYARKHHYIENNPARDILTKFEKDGDTPDPYTIEEMQQLFAGITEPEWQLILNIELLPFILFTIKKKNQYLLSILILLLFIIILLL